MSRSPVVLVTGALIGIGRAIAIRYGRAWARAGAVPAYRGRRCRPSGRQDRSGFTAERESRGRHTRAVPDGRVLPERPGHAWRSANGGHGPARELLRNRAWRAKPAGGRRRDSRRDPLQQLAGPNRVRGS